MADSEKNFKKKEILQFNNIVFLMLPYLILDIVPDGTGTGVLIR